MTVITQETKGSEYLKVAYGKLFCNSRGTVTRATYDAQDRLTVYGDASYAYTNNGELIARAENGAITQYDYDENQGVRVLESGLW